ncbi:MAG TPA: RNA pseudouridine synthase [Cellvibrionaceae bacterium]|nr:RNA pseudouridine synthase [Cellvibrionaceae bacterium]HNG61041.1 RNA pseudouridine synthase [Cellvibrionaceae bacterium]
MTETIRLSKKLIQQIGCSRREAELYIEGGWVTVDGEVIDQPQFPVADQTVLLLPGANTTAAGPITLIMHVAADLNKEQTLAHLIAANRWAEDQTAGRLLKRHLFQIKPCLPLLPGVAGMQILSQHWGLQRKFAEDGARMEQEFIVEVNGALPAEKLALLNSGLSFLGKKLPPAKVSWQSETRLRFALKNPQPGQIQSVCEQVGLEVITIKRIRIGTTSMGKMPLGQWRFLDARKNIG